MSQRDCSDLFSQIIIWYSIYFNFDLIRFHIIYFQYHFIIVWAMVYCLIFSFILSISTFQSLLFLTRPLQTLAMLDWAEIMSYSSSYRTSPYFICLIRDVILWIFLSMVKKDVIICWYSSWLHIVCLLFLNWFAIGSFGPRLDFVRIWWPGVS